MKPLMTAESLAKLLAENVDTVVLDVRWTLGDPHGADHYAESHLPGAVFADLESELANPASAEEGRHPLPSVERFEAATKRWGINLETTVVVYDNSGSMAAARAWWLLRAAGHQKTYVLDGGLAAWERAGGELVAGVVTPTPGTGLQLDPAAPWDAMATISQDEAGKWAQLHGSVDSEDGAGDGPGAILLDARAGERYRGEVEPIDPRPGHIPGAVSAPTAGNLTPSGEFLPVTELAARFASLGVVPESQVAAYCGSGITAAHTVLALENAGISAALYPGSYSQWSSNPANTVDTV